MTMSRRGTPYLWSCKCLHRLDDLRRGRSLSANAHSGNVFRMGEDVWFGPTSEGRYRRCRLTELRSVSESLSKVDQLSAPDKFRPLPIVERARNIRAISQLLRECERIRDTLRSACRRVWPNDEGGITGQCDSSESHLWTFKVENGLNEWFFRCPDKCCKRRGENTVSDLALTFFLSRMKKSWRHRL